MDKYNLNNTKDNRNKDLFPKDIKIRRISPDGAKGSSLNYHVDQQIPILNKWNKESILNE